MICHAKVDTKGHERDSKPSRKKIFIRLKAKVTLARKQFDGSVLADLSLVLAHPRW